MIRTQDFLDLDISVDATFFDPIANTDDISLTKAIFRKYFKENCSSGLIWFILTTLLQICLQIDASFQKRFQSMTDPDNTGPVDLKARMDLS